MVVLYGPSEKQLEVICLQINEDEGKLEENVNSLRQWLETQPHLPKKYDPRLLPLFVRGCKHDQARSRSKLERFFLWRASCPELFGSWDPHSKAMAIAMTVIEVAPLPRLTDEGCRVTMHRLLPHEDSAFIFKDVARFLLMMADLRIALETAISGDMYVFDARELRPVVLMRLATPLLRKALTAVQDGYPQRLKQIHVISAPGYVSGVLQLFKVIMKDKMRNRFIVHTTPDSLLDYMPSRILPSDYCGQSEPPLSQLSQMWISRLQDEKRIQQAEGFCHKADLSKKPHNNNNNNNSCQRDTLYGTEGTFRTLAID